MCGLVGIVSNNLVYGDLKVFSNMFRMNVIRGVHGSGIMRGVLKTRQIDDNRFKERPTIFYDKGVIKPDAFLDHLAEIKSRSYKHTTMDIFYAGHARQKTVGAETDANCHPFDTQRIIGMHNGTINGLYPHAKDFDTDSEALIHHISDVGLSKAIEDFKKHHGAIALAFWDKESEAFVLYRNHQRPLWCAYNVGFGNLLYASNPFIIEAAADEGNMRLETRPWQLEPGHALYLFADNRKKWTKENTKFVKIDKVYNHNVTKNESQPAGSPTRNANHVPTPASTPIHQVSSEDEKKTTNTTNQISVAKPEKDSAENKPENVSSNLVALRKRAAERRRAAAEKHMQTIHDHGTGTDLSDILPFNRPDDTTIKHSPTIAAKDTTLAAQLQVEEQIARDAFGDYSASRTTHYKPQSLTNVLLLEDKRQEKSVGDLIREKGDDSPADSALKDQLTAALKGTHIEGNWLFVGPNHRIMTFEEYQKLLDKTGCGGCAEVPDVYYEITTYGEEPTVYWTSAEEYVCGDCASTPGIREFLPACVQQHLEWIVDENEEDDKKEHDANKFQHRLAICPETGEILEDDNDEQHTLPARPTVH